MTKWIEYDGTNPPVNDGRYVLWEMRYPKTGWATAYLSKRRQAIPPDATFHYTYIDPPEPPRPKCPVCGEKMRRKGFSVVMRPWCCDSSLNHILTLSDEEAEKYR